MRIKIQICGLHLNSAESAFLTNVRGKFFSLRYFFLELSEVYSKIESKVHRFLVLLPPPHM